MATKKKKSSKPKEEVQKLNEVPSTRSLLKATLKMMTKHWRKYLVFAITFGLLLALFGQGPTQTSINEIKGSLTESLPDLAGDNTLIATTLIGESSNIGQTELAYTIFLFIIFSLAMIWLLRAFYEGKKVRVRDGFYRGMSGLVPVILVAVVILLQLIPLALGGLFYSVVSLNSIAVNVVEEMIVWSILLGLILLSFYFLSSSIMAIYIASLPNVSPIEALRQAKKVVRFKRSKIIVRMVLGLALFAIISGGVLLLLVAVLPAAASWWWWLVGVLVVPVAHTYLYNLYRGIL